MAPLGRNVADTMWEACSLAGAVSLRRFSLATTGTKPMFFRHARATRLAAVCLLFTAALLMVPKTDNPETPFDEGNTQTNEMVVVTPAPSREHRPSVTASVLTMLAQSGKISVLRSSLVDARLLTDARRLRELFCSFLC